MRAALIGITSLAALLAQAPNLHRRLADRRRKRPRQVLHTKRAAYSPPDAPSTPKPTPAILALTAT
jgi:hypothetical protein